jgi:seryl-tRNA synthetase
VKWLPSNGFQVRAGLATLGPSLLRVRSSLDSIFCRWAEESGAEAMSFPALMRVSDLNLLDYFRNFSHLAVAATPLAAEALPEYAAALPQEFIPRAHLCDGRFVLPSAACYNVYLYLREAILDRPVYVTTTAACFRNEVQFVGLERLWGFTMREIVCIGSREAAREHLASFKQRIADFAVRLELPLTVEIASDPFYQPHDARAVLQKLAPVKEEFVYGGRVAIASLNVHRNFFGERCAIRLADGTFAFTSCVAFGLERWLHALLDKFDEPAAAIDALARTAERSIL